MVECTNWAQRGTVRHSLWDEPSVEDDSGRGGGTECDFAKQLLLLVQVLLLLVQVLLLLLGEFEFPCW
jgi:hypothetical protein